MMLPNADVRTIEAILADTLPPSERREFAQDALSVGKEQFWNFLAGYFSDKEVKEAIAQFCISQLAHLEQCAGVRIDALITVADSRVAFGNFYDEVA